MRFGRAFYYGNRPAIGLGEQPAAGDLDCNLWQGPVPDDAVHGMKRYLHYDWHWLWHWGNGELGNNGVHFLDILRWGLKGGYPLRATYNGGRYGHDDTQETPDTRTAGYDFGHFRIYLPVSGVSPATRAGWRKTGASLITPETDAVPIVVGDPDAVVITVQHWITGMAPADEACPLGSQDRIP